MMKKKVTIQGVAGCYHDAAARLYFSEEEIETIPCDAWHNGYREYYRRVIAAEPRIAEKQPKQDYR